MEVKRNEKIGYAAVIGGVLLIVITYFSGKAGATDFMAAFAAVILGLSYIKGTLLTLTETELTLYATIGPLKKKYPISSKDQLIIDGNRVILLTNGNKTKLPIYKWLANTDDWSRLVMHTQQQ